MGESAPKLTWKKKLLLLLKVVFSVVMMALILRKVFDQDGAADLWSHLATLSWRWASAPSRSAEGFLRGRRPIFDDGRVALAARHLQEQIAKPGVELKGLGEGL